MDEMQVKVVVRDIDDNSPVFLQHNTTTGVRVNAPLYTVIETLTAVDADVDSSAVFYQVGFLSLRGFSSNCHMYLSAFMKFVSLELNYETAKGGPNEFYTGNGGISSMLKLFLVLNPDGPP